MHIEKCGGTSIHHSLGLSSFRYIHISKNRAGGNHEVNNITEEEFERLMYYNPVGIGGHSLRPYIDIKHDKFKNAKWVTFLRDPIERYMSHFNHALESGWIGSFEHYLSDEYSKNFIVKKIVGKSDLELAKEYLDNFFFIGTSENLSNSISILLNKLNLDYYGVPNKNVRKTKAKYISFDMLENNEKIKVIENNCLDIALYNWFLQKKKPNFYYEQVIEIKKVSNFRLFLHKHFVEKYQKKIVKKISQDKI